MVFDGNYVRENITQGYAVTVHGAQGVTADTTHAVLGENTTRAMLYVAMTRGRDTNTAYLYQRDAEHEYPSRRTEGVHVLQRGTSRGAGDLARAIVANHDDQAFTAHDLAAQAPREKLPEHVRRLVDCRATSLSRRRAAHHDVQTQATPFPKARDRARERHAELSRISDHGIDL